MPCAHIYHMCLLTHTHTQVTPSLNLAGVSLLMQQQQQQQSNDNTYTAAIIHPVLDQV